MLTFNSVLNILLQWLVFAAVVHPSSRPHCALCLLPVRLSVCPVVIFSLSVNVYIPSRDHVLIKACLRSASENDLQQHSAFASYLTLWQCCCIGFFKDKIRLDKKKRHISGTIIATWLSALLFYVKLAVCFYVHFKKMHFRVVIFTRNSCYCKLGSPNLHRRLRRRLWFQDQ